ncbi:MAG: phage integrase SAM-like domain-containing protein [Tannerellaceae bacterium]|nr:phage integrase SAM-like domain-containing protein [Tannerellaceae bacterium]
MTSCRFHFRASRREGMHTGQLLIRIIHKRKTVHIFTDYKIYPEEWDIHTHTITIPVHTLSRHHYLYTIKKSMDRDLFRLQTIIHMLEKQGEYSVKDIVRMFKKGPETDSLKRYCEGITKKLEHSGHERTARAYGSAVNSLCKFTGGREIGLKDIDTSLILAYESFLMNEGLKLNTISFYMRNLRAIYNRAIKENIILPKEESPFDKVFTGVAESEKRTLNYNELNQLAQMDYLLDSQTDKKTAGGIKAVSPTISFL